MQNGKTAVVSGLPTNVAYGSTEFHVLRPKSWVSAQWMHRVLRTRAFREEAATHFKGTAGQQRVPTIFLETVRIPSPPSREEEHHALQVIDQLRSHQVRLSALRKDSRLLSDACATSLLNHAFAAIK
jgi:type I restriction enzyme S subunit